MNNSGSGWVAPLASSRVRFDLGACFRTLFGFLDRLAFSDWAFRDVLRRTFFVMNTHALCNQITDWAAGAPTLPKLNLVRCPHVSNWNARTRIGRASCSER